MAQGFLIKRTNPFKEEQTEEKEKEVINFFYNNLKISYLLTNFLFSREAPSYSIVE